MHSDAAQESRFPNWVSSQTLVSCLIACAITPLTFAAFAGLTGSFPAAAVGSVVLALVVATRHRSVVPLDWTYCTPGFVGVSIAGAIAAAILLSRLTVFMVDPARTSWSTVPASDWELRHSCLTAYYVAAGVVRGHPNVYDESLYALPGGNPNLPRKPQMLGIFTVDQYEYPPPFLLAPRAISLVAPDFHRFRALWFGLSGLVVLGALVAAARSLDAPHATRALLLTPFVLGAPGTISTLQKGNVQPVVIAMTILAMALIVRRHRAAGGALLAFATVSKLYPGLLVVYLIARREWRATSWTAVFASFFLVLTVIDIGWAPFAAFREHLPGLMGGEAFPAFRNPASVGLNLSIPGLVFKARLFGMPGGGFGAMHAIGTAYMVIALSATVFLGLRRRKKEDGPILWLTVLVLATLRSPFLPWGYGTFPALWLVTLLAAAAIPKPWTMPQWLATVVVLGAVFPNDLGVDPHTMALVTTVPQVVMIALAALVIHLDTSRPIDFQHTHTHHRSRAASVTPG
jgi:hypothetical protein